MARKMNLEFQKALQKKKLLPFSRGKMLIKKELKAAEDDLNEAKDRLKNKKFKYATITAYYSMFHAVRALIYSKNYREKSHYYLLVALQALFIDNGLIDEELAEDFYNAMLLRESADYHSEFSKKGAVSCIESATKFLNKVKSFFKHR